MRAGGRGVGVGLVLVIDQAALDLLTSPAVRAAFDLGRESARLRERYGRTLFGSSALLARRLVERGVRFVNVSWDNYSNRFGVSNEAWDTHENNFPILRDTHLPGLDQTYAALLEDGFEYRHRRLEPALRAVLSPA